MLLEMTFKEPEAIREAAEQWFNNLIDIEPEDVCEEFKEKEQERLRDDVDKLMDKYMYWGEYITIQLDTETGMANIKLRTTIR